MDHKLIRIKTIKLLSRFLNILSDEDLLTVHEKNEIIAQLKNMEGSVVRYRNVDIVKYIMADNDRVC